MWTIKNPDEAQLASLHGTWIFLNGCLIYLSWHWRNRVRSNLFFLNYLVQFVLSSARVTVRSGIINEWLNTNCELLTASQPVHRTDTPGSKNIKAIVPWEIVFSVVVEDLLLFFKVFDWFFVGVFNLNLILCPKTLDSKFSLMLIQLHN